MVLPPLFGFPWEQPPQPTNPTTPAHTDPGAPVKAKKAKGPSLPEDYILVPRRRPLNPTWLKKYQEYFSEAIKRAAAETKHLKGADRVRAQNLLTARYIKELRGQPPR